MDAMFTAPEAAEILGYHPDYFRTLLRLGTIEGRKFGPVWMISRAEVDRVKALQGPGGRLPKTRKNADN